MAIDSNKLQQQAADLSSRLWAIANDLRGGCDLRTDCGMYIHRKPKICKACEVRKWNSKRKT